MRADAILSVCGTYRYALTWEWAPERDGRALFVMLNPSVADAQIDDPTLRRCIGFARAWGCGGLSVVNLFALRATDPAELRAHPDPVGPDCDAHLERALEAHARPPHRIVAAWGGNASLHPRLRSRRDAVLRRLPRAGTLCLAHTKRGDPLHPLYAPSRLAPTPYRFFDAPRD